MAITGDGQALTLFADINDSDFQPIVVDLKTGERGYAAVTAGSLKSGRDSSGRIVANVPGTDKFIVGFGGALHVWDGATGNSYVLSR